MDLAAEQQRKHAEDLHEIDMRERQARLLGNGAEEEKKKKKIKDLKNKLETLQVMLGICPESDQQHTKIKAKIGVLLEALMDLM